MNHADLELDYQIPKQVRNSSGVVSELCIIDAKVSIYIRIMMIMSIRTCMSSRFFLANISV